MDMPHSSPQSAAPLALPGWFAQAAGQHWQHNPVNTAVLPSSHDVLDVYGDIEQRRALLAKKPFKGGLGALKFYIKNLRQDLLKSIDIRPALRSGPQQMKTALRREFSQLLKPASGLLNLASDLAFTTLPTVFGKLAKGDVMGAVGELGKGSVLSAGGLAGTAVAAALLPGFGIPGLLLSNVFYEFGKRLVSGVTGLKPTQPTPDKAQQDNGTKATGTSGLSASA
jgi:hypothetical protein